MHAQIMTVYQRNMAGAEGVGRCYFTPRCGIVAEPNLLAECCSIKCNLLDYKKMQYLIYQTTDIVKFRLGADPDGDASHSIFVSMQNARSGLTVARLIVILGMKGGEGDSEHWQCHSRVVRACIGRMANPQLRI